MNSDKTIANRILRIWEPPDFFTIFEAIKRPPHPIRKGRILFSDGDPLERLYFIKEGFVKLYRIAGKGRETIAYLYGPGYVVGLRALLSKDNIAKHNAEALTDLLVITITHKEYFEIVGKYPAFAIDLTHYFMDRLEHTERMVEGFVVTDTTARIAFFFSDFVNRFCKKDEEDIVLPLPFTHQRIAEFVGALRETVSVSIGKLEKEGVLVIDKGRVNIIDLPKLHQFAQLDKSSVT